MAKIMKKRYIIIGIIFFIAYLIGCRGLMIKWLPSDSESDSMAVTQSGNFCQAFNGQYNTWLMESDADGMNAEIDVCPIGGKGAVVYIAASGDDIYIFSTWLKEQKQYAAVYGKKKSGGSYAELIKFCLGSGVDVEFTNFRSTDAGLVAIGIDQNSHDIVEIVYKDNQIKENRIQTSLHLVDAYVCNTGFYALDLWGNVYCCDENGIMSDTGIDNATYLSTSKTGIFYQYLDDDVLHFQDYKGDVHKEYKDHPFVRYVRTDTDDKRIAIKHWDDSVIFMDADGNRITDFKYLNIKLENVLLQIIQLWLLYTVCAIAVVIGCLLIIHCILLSKKMLIQVVSFLALTSIIWVLFMMRFVIRYDRFVDRTEAEMLTELYADSMVESFKERREELGIRYDEAINDRDFLRTIFEGDFTQAWCGYPIREELIEDTGNGMRIIYSKEDVKGLDISESYLRDLQSELPDKFEVDRNQFDTVTISERNSYVYWKSFGNEGTKLYLIARMPVEGINVSEKKLLRCFYFFVGNWLVIALGFAIAFHHIWRPVKLVNTQIEKMAKGDYSITNHGILDNEVGDIWTSLEVLCKNLSFRDYKKNNTLNAVLQYAPMHFEKIFDRNKLQEVQVGESAMIHTTVGMISVIDKDELIGGKIQQSYLKYVNMLLNILVEQDEQEEVVILQNDSNMEGVKIIFTGSREDMNAQESVYYGISCMESILARTQDIYEVNPFIFLHTAEFACGIAGGSGHAYPFVSGTDMDILTIYVDQLRNCNISMVVTEQTQKLLQNKYQTRYIGFVLGTDGQTMLKLYEVLDACVEKIRENKLIHDDIFQQGIRLYYEHEYFRARGQFVEYLKLCPEDGLAAWYLFACENGLTNPDGHNDNSLFGSIG